MFKKLIPLMFLFNSHENGAPDRNLTPSGDEMSPLVQKKSTLFTILTGEEQPRVIGGLLLLLVLLLHLSAGLWLLKSTERPKTPAPIIMQVSLVSAPSQQAQVPATSPTPPPPPQKKPEPPKKQPAKKPVQKKIPVIPKPTALPKPQAAAEPTPTLPSIAPAASTSTAASTSSAVSRPGPATAKVSNESRISSGVVPLERIPPKYPMRAAHRHIEGWVKVEFTITTHGKVKDAVVIEAEPAEVFDEAALRAIEQWIFKEKIVNGVAVEQRAVQTLQFKLSK